MQRRGNKGEWSELLVLLKLLIDKKLYFLDKFLGVGKNKYLDINKILKKNVNEEVVFEIKNWGVIVSRGNKVFKIKNNILHPYFIQLKDLIIRTKSHSFDLLEIDDIFNLLHINNIKSTKEDKNDLYLFFEQGEMFGFNIKSSVGASSSLLNPSLATNFIFKINNIKKEELGKIQALPIKEKIKELSNQGACLEFDTIDNGVFFNNIQKIDTRLVDILALIVKNYYGSQIVKIKDCEKILTKKVQNIYIPLIKRFLLNIALGMNPKTKWEGREGAKGGYIIINKLGEVGGVLFKDGKVFSDFLYNNTKLDTPSLSRHKFGSIYCDQGVYKIKLNLQIRFIK